MSTKVRVRYLLRDPITPRRLDAPRPAVSVTVEADGLDERGTVLYEGQDNSVKYVRRALGELLSSGIRGRLLDELPTPRNLVAVMGRPSMRQFEPACVAGLEAVVTAEQALSEALPLWSGAIASLLADTLPQVLAFAGPPRATLIEQIDLLVAQGRALVDELPLPPDALVQAAGRVWQLLGQTGKDPAWLSGLMPEVAAVIDTGAFQAPQSGRQAGDVIRHLAEALNAPERSTLPALVAQLEADWAVGSAA
ncbi:MAG TPA: hypothetical protein VFS21_34420 [Roseiflexaceae bacterium]|nr:hypothetical protein [Roseiflexaceae bacterium]